LRQLRRRAHARVKAPAGNRSLLPGRPDAFEKFRADYMRVHKVDNVDDIDPFKFPTFKEYLTLRVKNPAVLKGLLAEEK
jgi:hypothetical protein